MLILHLSLYIDFFFLFSFTLHSQNKNLKNKICLYFKKHKIVYRFGKSWLLDPQYRFWLYDPSLFSTGKKIEKTWSWNDCRCSWTEGHARVCVFWTQALCSLSLYVEYISMLCSLHSLNRELLKLSHMTFWYMLDLHHMDY